MSNKPSDSMAKFQTMLKAKIGAEVYQAAADSDDLLVALCRLKPMIASDKDLKMAETRALRFIEDALKKTASADTYQVRFSRPWVLKGEKLAFTWDFTIKGSIKDALSDLESVQAMKPPATREEEVPVQTLKPRRGSVRQVSVGAIR